MKKVKLWTQLGMDFDEIDDRLADEDGARERRNRERDETRMKSGRNQRRLRKAQRERKAAHDE